MAEIRPLQRSDLPAVSALLGANLPEWTSGQSVPQFLAATLLDDPWAEPELSSLVAVEDEAVTGFIGAAVRRFSFGDRELRGVCASHLTVDPGRRGGAAGALLLRRLLAQGQDFTYSDTANDAMARMCVAFGGQLDQTRTSDWMILLRPGRWLRTLAAAVLRRRELGEEVPVGALPFKAVLPGGRERSYPRPAPGVSGEDAGPAQLAAALAEIAPGRGPRPAYDEAFLAHLFELARSQFGGLVSRLVRRDGRALGGYVYAPQRGGAMRVLALFVGREGEPVLAEMVEHARAGGATAIGGRMEPHLVATMQPWMPALGFTRRPWIHTHEPEVLAALQSAEGVLTRLDGEWFVN
jgi:hypothetical protein